MHNIKAIYIKEMKSFFNSPMAYIFLGVFVLINGYFFTSTFFLINQSDLRALFDIIRWVYIIFIPAITMGLIAREKALGTMEVLSTLPIKDSEFVIGKYLESLHLIKNDKTYVILTKNEGILYKRISIEEEGKIKLTSDNLIYKPYNVSFKEIIELWEAVGFFTHDLPNPNDTINHLHNIVENIQSDINNIKNKIN